MLNDTIFFLLMFVSHLFVSQCLTIEGKLQLKTMMERRDIPTLVTHTHTVHM